MTKESNSGSTRGRKPAIKKGPEGHLPANLRQKNLRGGRRRLTIYPSEFVLAELGREAPKLNFALEVFAVLLQETQRALHEIFDEGEWEQVRALLRGAVLTPRSKNLPRLLANLVSAQANQGQIPPKEAQLLSRKLNSLSGLQAWSLWLALH